MVQKSHTKQLVLGIVFRFLALLPIFFISFWSGPFFENFVKQYFQESTSFVGFLQGFETGFLSLALSFVFWTSLTYASLGKKVDFIFSGIVFVLTFILLTQETNISPYMYLGLFGISILGNVLGYCLKIGIRNYWPKRS